MNSEKQCEFCLKDAESANKLNGYNLTICGDCWDQASNGWDKRYDRSLFEALKKNSLLIPDRNEQGLLPREYQPPLDFNL